MSRKILKLIEIRIFAGFFLLLSIIIIQLAFLNLFPAKFFFSFLGLLFTLSVLYLFMLRIGIREGLLINIQLVGDWFLISYLILNTGGYESLLYFLFVFLILEAFYFFKNKKTLLVVSLTPLLSYLIFAFTSFYFKVPNTEFSYSKFTTGLIIYFLGFPALAYLLVISREELSKLTRGLILKEEEKNFALKLDEIMEKAHQCVVLIQEGRLEVVGRACRGFPVEELVDKRGTVRSRGRIYRVSRLPLSYGELLIIDDYTQRWFTFRREGVRETISIISHELRNPLASILGALQLMPSLDEGKKKEFMNKIRERAEKINEIILRWGSLGSNPSPGKALSKLKELLSVEGAKFDVDFREGEFILRRTPPLTEKEITTILQPNLKELPTGKGFAALELAYIIAEIDGILTATPQEVVLKWKKY